MEHYSKRPLTEREWEEIEMILYEQLELQDWFAVTFVVPLGEEILLVLH